MADRSSEVRRESGDLVARPILWIVLGWFVFVLAALALIQVLYSRSPREPPFPPQTMFPTPRLVTAPNTQLAAQRAPQKALLSTSGWLDRRNGIAHIPIDRAMTELLKRPDPYSPLGGAATPQGASR